MSKLAMIARYILGLIYFVFGLNGFLNFIQPPQQEFSEAAMAFMSGLMGTGYFFPFLKGTEVVCGLLLLAGLWSPLALIILAPITINIVLFHGLMTPGLANQIMPIAMLALHLIAAMAYSRVYKPLLKMKA